MAANVSEKSRTSNNVINVTTSETMRLDGGGDRTNLHLQPMGGGPGGSAASQGFQQAKKKNSSFQITSITSRLSNDGGEDSADDTEDISDIADNSRVTDFDQETPSYSEEYSRTEEVFFGPAPVIPTSSQYGITALVQQTGSGGVMTARLPQGVTVNVTEGGIALAKADGESDDIDNWQNRFKIVKIDSNEPFKRGRWICLDFMDSPAVNPTSNLKKDDNATVIINNVGDKDDGLDHQPQTVLQVPVPVTQQNQMVNQNQPHSVPAQYQVPHSSQTATPMAPSSQQTASGVPMQLPTHMPASAPVQSQGNLQYTSQGAPMQGQQLQPPMSQGYANTSQTPQGSVHPSPSAQTPPQAQPPLQPQLQQQQTQPPMQQATIQQPPSSQPGTQPTIQASTIPQAVAQSTVQQTLVPPSSLTQPQHQPVQSQSSLGQPSINAQTITQQGIPGQNVSIPQSVAQPGVMSHAGIPAQSLQPQVIGSMASQGVSMAQPVVSHQGVPQSVMSQPQQGVQVPQPTLPQSVPTPNVAQNQQQINQSLPSQPIPGSQPIQQVPTSGQQLPISQQMPASVGQTTMMNQNAIGTSQQVPVAASASSVQPTAVAQPGQGSHPGTGGAPTPATTPAQAQTHMSMGGATDQQPQQPPGTLEGIQVGQPMEDSNATPPAASGTQPEDTESFRGLAHALSCGVFPNMTREETSIPLPPMSSSPSMSMGYMEIVKSSSAVASRTHTPPPPAVVVSMACHHPPPPPSPSPLQHGVAFMDFGAAVPPPPPTHSPSPKSWSGSAAASFDKDTGGFSASTASTVAIDNKIEQAMDLVKSHLMFAVREEVEVLKEKISELMERITQLEYENTVLRQYATQEALQQLQQPHHSSNT